METIRIIDCPKCGKTVKETTKGKRVIVKCKYCGYFESKGKNNG